MLCAVNSTEAAPTDTARKRSSFDPAVAAAVGQAARQRRESIGLAQDAFSLKAGVDRSYYGRLERGERQPTVSLLLRIAGALGMSGAELLAEAETLLAKGKRPRKKVV
ncbi:helix-turn-helix domain-containing protein [Roseateles sp. BYS96W]|uniref:Helix-turn-helix domain-containing protein n=1 Tax=Pelomonas nitida TaxID=3299027 RepID=A0ABW7GD71_9BURK